MSGRPHCFMELAIGGRPVGRVILELFSDVAPKCSENFRALCTGERGLGRSGKPLHYKGNAFHRVISGFMMQGGDTTRGDGSGGESIYGERFADEPFVHEHSVPGLLSMANAGPHTNGSQFFITFGTPNHLNGKHVVFGRVVQGLNIIRQVERVPVGPNDRPKLPVIIVDCGVLALPGSTPPPPVAAAAAAASSVSSAAHAAANSAPAPAAAVAAVADPVAAAAARAAAARAEEEAEAAAAQLSEEALAGMSERERKMHQLRMRIQQGKKANRKEVVTEHKRLTADPAQEKKRKRYEDAAADGGEEGGAARAGGGGRKPRDEAERLLETTAAEAAEKAHRDERKQKHVQSFGWQRFSEDAHYNRYKKRAAALPVSAGGAEGALAPAGDLHEAMLSHGAAAAVAAPAVDRMVDELNGQVAARANIHRRRAVNDDEDVTFINEKNRIFNRAAERYYGKYTVEIKQNLERGTAL